jgi:hypothetical protein
VDTSPGQYTTPRRLTAPGASYFQMMDPVSGRRAKTVDPAVTYICPSITSGVTCRFELPVSNTHACCSVATFFGVICVSGENRVPPGSRPTEGQSPLGSARIPTGVADNRSRRPALIVRFIRCVP